MDKIKVDKEEFARLKADKNHKEMLSVLKSIKLPEPKDDSELQGLIKLLTAKLEVLQSPKITVEKTEVNQKEVVNLLKELISEIKSLNKQEKKEEKEKKDYIFTVNRDNNGYIQSVTAKQQ